MKKRVSFEEFKAIAEREFSSMLNNDRIDVSFDDRETLYSMYLHRHGIVIVISRAYNDPELSCDVVMLPEYSSDWIDQLGSPAAVNNWTELTTIFDMPRSAASHIGLFPQLSDYERAIRYWHNVIKDYGQALLSGDRASVERLLQD